ncbi:hypothetical protein ADK56_17315 [Streptomyces sp. MMG1522]|nr:hypothetical protein ADK56_17315 [Streptomyces sp. MMG1522]
MTRGTRRGGAEGHSGRSEARAGCWGRVTRTGCRVPGDAARAAAGPVTCAGCRGLVTGAACRGPGDPHGLPWAR